MGYTIDLQQIVVEKALRDADYRAKLLADPRAIVTEELQRYSPTASMPEGKQIRIVEEGADEVVIVLPTLRAASEPGNAPQTDGNSSTFPAVTWMWDPCACL